MGGLVQVNSERMTLSVAQFSVEPVAGMSYLALFTGHSTVVVPGRKNKLDTNSVACGHVGATTPNP